MREILDVILPAGGRISGAFAAAVGTETKALIPLEGKTILRRTIETLRATERVGRIVVIGPEEARGEAKECGADGVLEEGASGPENAFHGLEWLRAQPNSGSHVLLMATDLPFLTPEALNGFLDACPPDADLALPIVTERAFRERFPDSPSVFVRLRDGSFTLGCAFRIRPETLLRNRAQIDQVFAARKSQWAMGRLLGLPFLLRFATRQLEVAHIETRCQEILNCKGAAVPNSPAELAYDIDLPEEYAYAAGVRQKAKGERDG
jgi:CTP:molybdopterin cytidylyltransferase MocA